MNDLIEDQDGAPYSAEIQVPLTILRRAEQDAKDKRSYVKRQLAQLTEMDADVRQRTIDLIMTVGCSFCGAEPGKGCTNFPGRPGSLHALASHADRKKSVGLNA